VEMETRCSQDAKPRLAREAEYSPACILLKALASRQTSDEGLCPQAGWWRGCSVSDLAYWLKRFLPGAQLRGLKTRVAEGSPQ